MSDETFNMSLRKFLKQVGVTSQQQIEKVVREEKLEGRLFRSQIVGRQSDFVPGALVFIPPILFIRTSHEKGGTGYELHLEGDLFSRLGCNCFCV